MSDTDVFEAARWPEERLGVIHQYKNNGLYYKDNPTMYLKMIENTEKNINMYNNGFYNTIYNYSPFKTNFLHFIYKIPRRW